MKKANETNAAEAFALVLSAVNNRVYRQIDSPDEKNRITSDIDFVYASASGRMSQVAAEHTIVESFEGQLAYVNQSFDIAAEINTICMGKIPPDRYYFLAIPDLLVKSLGRPARSIFVQQISPVVAKECLHLQENDHSTIPFNAHEIWLMCRGSHPEMNGNIFRIPKAPQEGDTLQRQRLARALSTKLPNLCKYRLRGFITALLLEDISGGVSNLGFHGRSLGVLHRIVIRLFVNYVVVFASNDQRMIVGNVWKENGRWYGNVPYARRFSFTHDATGNMQIGN